MTACARVRRSLPLLALVGGVAVGAWLPADADAQIPAVWIEAGDGPPESVTISAERGYAVFPITEAQRLGWSLERRGDSLVARTGRGDLLRAVAGSPFFHWNGTPLQLADPPFVEGAVFLFPVQLLVDFVPRWFPDRFMYDPTSRTLSETAAVEPAPSPEPDPPESRTPAVERRVVVIDPGHGGIDPGTIGAGGVREKDIALGVALALQRILEESGVFEVYLTRDRDTLIPLWRRGEMATRWKGTRPGVFVSLHANAMPGSRATRGVETYFLSEARTDHERRVAALENAAIEGDGGSTTEQTGLGFILQELRNHDHQHWSALLAELVQEELASVHTGPDRGVRQGELAVITNALMPSVLIELGFLSNRTDELLLRRPEFHRSAAEAIEIALVRFFERYPPGPARTGGR